MRYCKSCPLIATYNHRGKKAKYCTYHKKDNQCHLKHYCTHVNCITKPLYGMPGFPRVRCTLHRLPGMILSSLSKCYRCHKKVTFRYTQLPTCCENDNCATTSSDEESEFSDATSDCDSSSDYQS